MPVPEKIREILDQTPEMTAALPGSPAPIECEGSQHHSPRPIVLHAVSLPDERVVMLCGTCRDNVETLVAMRRTYSGSLPWPVRREFGNTIRALAGV